MKIYLKQKDLFTYTLCLLFTGTTYCQQELNNIEASYAEYKKHSLAEKIFAHTDKDFYLAGEIAWFKLYVVDADSNTPLDLSKVVYVEVVGNDQKPVAQVKIAITNGIGSGSIVLPLSVNSGIYKLRAYTSWMKNFGPEFYFEKTIAVVNSLKGLNPQLTEGRKYDVQFFPEGGQMVAGLQGRVAFRIIDETGHGVNSDGFVISPANDTVAQFHSLKFGMGSFLFTPSPATNYKAMIKLPDTVLIRDLPGPVDEGYVLRLDTLNGRVSLNISTNIKSSNVVYLFVQTRQTNKIAERIVLTNGTGTFTIDKNKLGDGISQFTIFDSQYRPVCERLFFIRPQKKLVIQPSATQGTYSSRQKVSIRINSTDEVGNRQPADISVSVYRVDSVQGIPVDGIGDYLWLTSELKGKIESPGYYLNERGAEVDAAIDNLMLTHGWRRFRWQAVLQQKQPVYSFVPEYSGHIIYARVTKSYSGSPAPGVLTYLSVPGSRVQLYDARSDSSGVARFYTKDFYGPAEIVLQADSNSNSVYKIEIVSPFSDKFLTWNPPALNVSNKFKEPLADYSVSMQVQSVFSADKLKQFHVPAFDSAAFFGSPDIQYLLDNYTRFSTMEEVLREYVYEVLVRRQRENFRFILADADNKLFLNDPLTLFNGVPVFDPNKIIQYDPLKVRKIEIVKRRYFYGPSIFNGIVNFVTYQPDAAMVSQVSPVILEYEGLQFQREFFSPTYETPDQVSSRLPDFRNVLYWSPNVVADSQGKAEINFFTSDLKGKYVAVLQGLNTSGRIGQASISFEVK